MNSRDNAHVGIVLREPRSENAIIFTAGSPGILRYVGSISVSVDRYTEFCVLDKLFNSIVDFFSVCVYFYWVDIRSFH